MWRFFPLLNTENRHIGLDVFRTLALVCVLVGHSFELFRHLCPEVYRFFFLLRDGIEIFFGISGFLVALPLFIDIQQKGQLDYSTISRFFRYRWFKTLPAYFLMLLVNLAVAHYCMPELLAGFSWRFFFFLQNLKIADFYFFPVTYSLAIEEWFYLLLPVMLLVISRLLPAKARRFSGLGYALLTITIATGCRIMMYTAGAHWEAVLRKSVVSRIDAPAYGVIIAWLYVYKKPLLLTYRHVLFKFGVLLFLSTIYLHRFIGGFYADCLYFNLVPLSIALLIPGMLTLEVSCSRTRKIFAYISLTSYSFYLVHHMPVLALISHFWQAASWLELWTQVLAYTALSLFFAYMLYFLFERPIAQWRDRI